MITDRERKSESRETTFPIFVTHTATLHRSLDRLVESVCRGLAAEQRAGRTVTLKIRLRPFRTHTRSRTLDQATRDPDRVRAICRELLAAFELDAPVRLLGVGVSGLVRGGGGEPAHRPGPVSAEGSLAIEA